MTIQVRPDTDELRLACRPAYLKTLVAPRDDMWATFEDLSAPHAIHIDGEPAGCCSVSEERALHQLYLQPSVEDRAAEVLDAVIQQLDIAHALPSTVDPGFLAIALERGHDPQPIALMYAHVVEPLGPALSDLRLAGDRDLDAAVAFAHGATGMPAEFLEPYFEDRIGQTGLYLHEESGELRATGECRPDIHHPGHAHLGLIVGEALRGRGVGSALMHALVTACRGRQLTPLCSTEPANLPARKVISRAGFRARHRVFRVAFGADS